QSADISLPSLRSTAKSFFTTRGELAWNEAEASQAAKSRPHRKLSIGGANASTASAVNGANPGDGLQSPRGVSFFRQRLDLRGSGFDSDCLLGDLVNRIATFLAHQIGEVTIWRI